MNVERRVTIVRMTQTVRISLRVVRSAVLAIVGAALLARVALAGDGSVTSADRPLPPEEAPRHMTLPDGFHVTLFAGVPDVAQPIGFTTDDRGRLWIAECYSY